MSHNQKQKVGISLLTPFQHRAQRHGVDPQDPGCGSTHRTVLWKSGWLGGILKQYQHYLKRLWESGKRSFLGNHPYLTKIGSGWFSLPVDVFPLYNPVSCMSTGAFLLCSPDSVIQACMCWKTFGQKTYFSIWTPLRYFQHVWSPSDVGFTVPGIIRLSGWEEVKDTALKKLID